MRIHYLKCGTDCPLGGPLFDGFSKSVFGVIPCAAQLVETNDGLVLVDTGYGTEDVRHPHPRLSVAFRLMLNIRFRMRETAVAQVKALGYSPSDVRHIVLTHLDFDHAGGIEDFPNARVHVMEAERDAAERKRRGFVARRRYRPAQWDDVRDWRTYGAGGGERWFGFEAVRGLDGLPPEILMVPMPGHTWGHAGVAIDSGQGWVLNAGDAYFYRRELEPKRRCTPGLRFYQTLMEVDREARFANQARLRDLKQDRDARVTIFCSHDEKELEAMQRSGPGGEATVTQ